MTTERSPRLPCPVCLGTTMQQVRLGPGGALEIDHCRRCGGLWLEYGEVQQLRARPSGEMWDRIGGRTEQFRMRCHDCHLPMSPAETRCAACGWAKALDCPACQHPMRVTSHAGLLLDVCKTCKGVWFDRHELWEIWGSSFDQALQRRQLSRRRNADAGTDGVGVGDVVFEVLSYSPDLVPDLIGGGVRVAGHAGGAAVKMAAEAAGAAPEVAGAVFEAVGEAGASVFEVIVEIIGGVFEGI